MGPTFLLPLRRKLILSPLKIRARPSFKPRNLSPMASMLTSRPPMATTTMVCLVIVNPIVIVILWRCFRYVGYLLAFTISGYIAQVKREFGLLQKDFATRGTTPVLGTNNPSGDPCNSSTCIQEQKYLTPRALPPTHFPIEGFAHSDFAPGPEGQLSPALATRPVHPCSSTLLIATLVKEWPKWCGCRQVNDELERVRRKRSWPNLGCHSSISWRDWVIQRKTCKNGRYHAEIWTRDPPNSKQKC
jgi:hypothetical protein